MFKIVEVNVICYPRMIWNAGVVRLIRYHIQLEDELEHLED